MSECEHAAQPMPGDRFLERIHLVSAAIYYLSLGLCLTGALAAGELRGWRLAAALALVGVSVTLFQGIYWRVAGRVDTWPMAPRVALAYFAGQLLALAALLSISDSFVGLGFVLMGQCFGVLRPRFWALPLLPLVALLARPLGWLNLDAGADWLGLAALALQLGIWLFIAALLSLLFTQRFRLLGVVRELREARARLEAAAAQQEELVVLRERTRLAREMHDSIGHALVSVNVKLEAAQRLYRVDAARGDAELEGTRALVRETMGALRHSIADLRAPLPDHRDLPDALRRLVAEVRGRSPLVVAVRPAPDAPAPEPTVAEALFQVAREALRNVERHAGATRATVSLDHGAAGWSLEVADDGLGVRPDDLRKPGHFGVVGMRERVAALGGALHIAPGPEGGTRVTATIPNHPQLER